MSLTRCFISFSGDSVLGTRHTGRDLAGLKVGGVM